ncbi:hypothetical protein L195_g045292 [Trifolium pratense]|uniref:Uncharacterized protein n=2 Tax=Trifolium pratense TaxID=57577 RepID=A0A2K3MEG2_TRIPR|nr:hypothetical protein L195_g045292 [Trifolium pratense]
MVTLFPMKKLEFSLNLLPNLNSLIFSLNWSKYPSIAQEIESFANVDRARRKLNALQVHGEIEEGNVRLDRDTGKSAQSAFSGPSKLVDAFQVHAEIEEGNVMLDRDTGK